MPTARRFRCAQQSAWGARKTLRSEAAQRPMAHRLLYRGRGNAALHDESPLLERENKLARVEAVLLCAGEPLTSRKLAQVTGLADGTEARTLIRTLNRHYDADGSSFRAEELAGGFQLLTRPQFAPWLRRLYPAAPSPRLSSPALETLAVIAYRQPAPRAEIEAVRGVQSGEIVRQLMERDLVRICGRSSELGRPYLYGTTKRFLRVFGLKHLDDLPRANVLRGSPLPCTLAPTNAAGGVSHVGEFAG